MSWSVSRPEFKTKTSPCSVGFIVPASTLRYGSTLTRLTEKPLAAKIFPIDAVATPLPTPDMTPPVTKIYLVSLRFLGMPIHQSYAWRRLIANVYINCIRICSHRFTLWDWCVGMRTQDKGVY